VLAAGRKVGCPVGIHTFSIAECEARTREGWQFVAVLSELGFMNAEAARTVEALGIRPHGGPAAAEGAPAAAGAGLSKY